MSALRALQLHRVETLPSHDRDGDAELVARAKVDPQAFAGLYRRHVDAIFRYCAHRLGGRQAAEDATSEIFVKALAGIRSCRDGRAFRGWLFAIAHNVVTDGYRARHPDEPIEAADGIFDPAPNPEDAAIVADGERSVHALLTRLAPRQARILELRLAGLTGPEIADVLGCSLANVKIGQVRGYARLREIIDELGWKEVRDEAR
jgi:RNA polymerase sigma-70 factor (ECF subfamily)